MKKLLILATLFPFLAIAQTAPQDYALVCTSPCSVQTTDTNGNLTTVQEPSGYVTDVILWNGNTSVWQSPAGYEVQPDFTGAIQIGQTVTP
jgi:hypothetical protein